MSPLVCYCRKYNISNGASRGVVVHMKEIGNKEYKNSMFSVEPHVQSKGWVDYGMITKDTIIGTVGEKKRIECLCFEGDFEYRVHIQNSGWTDWTRADGVATLGTVGQELRIEAIQFR